MKHQQFLKSTAFLAGIVLLLVSQWVFANDRLALVIGNANYLEGALTNPVNDATDIASVLRSKLGFDVIERHNLNRIEMLDVVEEFQTQLEAANNPIAFFYFAGHGVQYDNHNYLIPVNARIKKQHQVEAYGVNANTILKAMRAGNIHLGIALLDACRNNPYERNIRGFGGQGRGLARAESVSGIIVGYATRPGSIAEDGNGRNSPYASVLKEVLALDNYSVQDMLNEVGLRVKRQYGQEPWVSSSPVPRVVLATGVNSTNKAEAALGGGIFGAIASMAVTAVAIASKEEETAAPSSNTSKSWSHKHPAIKGCTNSITHSHKYNTESHNHKYSCKSVNIHALQRKLKAQGYYSGSINGVVTPATRSALQRYMNNR